MNIHHQVQGLVLIEGINFTILGGELMAKLLLKALLCTSCVVLGTASHGSAGGLERGGYNIDLLFDPDRFATEATSIYVMPNRKLNNVRDSSPWDGPVGGGRTDGVKESEAYWFRGSVSSSVSSIPLIAFSTIRSHGAHIQIPVETGLAPTTTPKPK